VVESTRPLKKEKEGRPKKWGERGKKKGDERSSLVRERFRWSRGELKDKKVMGNQNGLGYETRTK